MPADIRDTLFDLTQGIAGLAKVLFALAQRRAMNNGQKVLPGDPAKIRFRQPASEDDALCMNARTGWFIFSPCTRQAEVARYLGLPDVYCVGQYPGKVNPKILFVQPSREVDPRNGKLKYVIVDEPEHVKAVADILRREYTPEERADGQREDAERMEMARRGLL
jgi:hypothetical protein